MESGRETVFRLKTKKNQKIHDFRTKKRVGNFSTFLTPPHPSPPFLTPQSWFQVGEGGLWGSGPTTPWGVCLLNKIKILQNVTRTNQPLEVGYANGPKKPQKGEYVALFPIYGACVALI